MDIFDPKISPPPESITILGTPGPKIDPIPVTEIVIQPAPGILNQEEPERKALGRNISVRQTDAAWRLIYGEVRTGGVYTFVTLDEEMDEEAFGEWLHFVITLAAHEINDVTKLFLDSEEVVFGGGSYHTDARWGLDGTKWNNIVFMSESLGTDAQVANADLLAQSNALFPGVWTADHRQRGHAHVYHIFQFDPDVFPNGLPRIEYLIEGKADIYDPRGGGSTGYTNNAALVIADYLTDSRRGLGADYATEIDEANLEIAADICDEAVNLNPSGTENRYEINGVIEVTDDHRTVLQKMATAIGGPIVYSGGLWKIFPGDWRTPSITLTEDDLRSDVKIQTKPSKNAMFNAIRGQYYSPDADYKLTDFPAVRNATYETEDGDEVIWRDVQMPLTTSSAACQRISKIYLEDVRQSIVVEANFGLAALELEPEDNVYLTLDRFGWSAKEFRVVRWRPVIQSGQAITVSLTLKETASGIYDWNMGEETVVDLAPNTNLPDPSTVTDPTGLTLASGTEHLYTRADGTIFSRIKASWDAITDPFVNPGGSVEVSHKKSTVEREMASLISANSESLVRTDATLNDLDYNGNQNFFYSGFVQLDAKVSQRGIVGRYAFGSNNRSYLLTYDSSSDRFYAYVSSDGTAGNTTSVEATAAGSPNIGEIYFIAFGHSADDDELWIEINRGTRNTSAHSTGVYAATADLEFGEIEAGSYLDGKLGPWATAGIDPNSDLLDALYNDGAPRSFAELPTVTQSHFDGTYQSGSYWDMDEESNGVAAISRIDSGASANSLTDSNTTASTELTLGSWNWEPSTPVPGDMSFSYILDVEDNKAYDVRIRNVNAFNNRSSWVESLAHTVIGKTEPPSDVQNLTASVNSYGIRLEWDAVTDQDLSHYVISVGDNRENRVTYSEQFENWSLLRASISSNQTTDPLMGTSTVDELIEDNTSNSHYAIRTTGTLTQDIQYRYSAYVKRGSGTRDVELQLAGASVDFHFDTVTVGSASAFDDAGIEALADDWFYVWVKVTPGATGTASAYIGLITTTGTQSYPGDGTSSLYIWGAHIVSTSATNKAYILSAASVVTSGSVSTLAEIQSTSYLWDIQDSDEYHFTVYAVDTTGNRSDTDAAGTVTIADPGSPAPSASFDGPDVVLTWTEVPEATNGFAIDAYEISYGATYGASTPINETKSSEFRLRVTWTSSRKFWVAARDVAGNLGTAVDVDVDVVAPSSVVDLAASVIDNNVQLTWSEPAMGSLPIETYCVYKGDTFVAATAIGCITGTFKTVLELVKNTYTYWVTARDTAGNESTEVSVTAFVNQPPDYVLQDLRTLVGEYETLDNVIAGTKDSTVPTLDIKTTYGPTLWLEADTITGNVGETVTTWSDASGNGYDFDQATDSSRPRLTSATNDENLQGDSEDIRGAATTWTASNVTVTSNSVTAPDGATTANTLEADTSVGVRHYIYNNTAYLDPRAGQVYHIGCYVKKQNHDYVWVGDGGDSVWRGAVYDFSTGAFAGGGYDRLEVEDVGSDWYKLTVTVTRGNDGGEIRVGVGFSDTAAASDRPPNHTPAGTEEIYIWGAFIYRDGSSGNYVQTTGSPYYRGVNGTQALVFDGHADHLDCNGAADRDDFFDVTGSANKKTIITAFRPHGIESDDATVYQNECIVSDESGNYTIAVRATGPAVLTTNYDGTSDFNVHTDVDLENSTKVVTLRHDSTNLFSQMDRGTEVSTASGDSSGADTYYVYLGRSGSGAYFCGEICEVIFFDTVLSDTEVAEIEGYLTAKWTPPQSFTEEYNTGELVGPVKYLTGIEDNHAPVFAEFTSANSEYLSITDASQSNLDYTDEDFFFAGHVVIDADAADKTILTKDVISGSNRSYVLEYDTPSDNFEFHVSNDGSALVTVSATTFGAVELGRPVFVACGHRATDNEIWIQINRGTEDTTAHTTGVYQASTAAFTLGQRDGGVFLDGALRSWCTAAIDPSTALLDALHNGGIPRTFDQLPDTYKEEFDGTNQDGSYWNLDEESDGSGAVTRVDSGASGNDLTDNSTVTSRRVYVPYATRTGRQFDSANNERFIITDASQTGLDFSGSSFAFTMMCRVDSLAAARRMIIKWVSAGNQRSYFMEAQTDGTIDYFVSSDGSTNSTLSTTDTLVVDRNHFVYFDHRDGIDINATIDNGTAATSAHTTGLFDGTADFGLGGDTASLTWDGAFWNVAAWNRTLSADEQTFLYNYGMGRMYSELPQTLRDACVSYWDGDEGSGDLLDSGPNGNDLTDTNTVTTSTVPSPPSLQDYIDESYTIPLQPGEGQGSIIQYFDFGVSLAASLISLSYQQTNITGITTIVPQIDHSADESSWTNGTAGNHQELATTFQFVRVTITFDGDDDKAVTKLEDVKLRLDVKRSTEEGTFTSNSGDASGTTVTFVKDWIDVDSIVLSLNTTSAYHATYDFTDTPNPTSFKVFAWDDAGGRVTASGSYTVRGIEDQTA